MAAFRDVLQWVCSQLAGDGTLASLGVTGVFMYNAPENTPFPYLIMQKQTGNHTYALGKEAFHSHWLAIKCVDKSWDGGDTSRQVMGRVKELINLQTPPGVLHIKASTDFEMQENEPGNLAFPHAGTVFVITLAE